MKIAVFDLDGTLVSSENTIIVAAAKALARQGVVLEPSRISHIRDFIGLSAREIFQQICPQKQPHFYDTAIQDFEDEYFELIHNHQQNLCYPYIKEQLAQLDEKGWILAICTGKGRRGTEIDLKYNNIDHHFALLKTSSDGYAPKPNPQILEAAIAECGGTVNEAVMIGDTSYDIDMAHKIGVKSLAVLWGYHHKEALVNASDFIDNPQDLSQKLEALLS